MSWPILTRAAAPPGSSRRGFFVGLLLGRIEKVFAQIAQKPF
jgi:hypothetical protein